MSRDLTIPDRLRRFEVPVLVQYGWEKRGNDGFVPRGGVEHGTVSNPPRVAPSLNVVTNGRSDLTGPLCNVLGTRDRQAIVVASGKANHAGSGRWRGLDSNYEVHGFEFEHTNIISTEPFDSGDFEFTCRVMAALAFGFYGPEMVCQHWEWTPRKIDLLEGTLDPRKVRQRVAELLKQGGAKPLTVEQALPVFPGFTLKEGHGYFGRTSPRVEKAVTQIKFALTVLGYRMNMQGADASKFGESTSRAIEQEVRVHNYLASLSSDPKVRADQWPVNSDIGARKWDWIMRRARDTITKK